MTEFMYQAQYTVPLIIVPSFLLASISETVAESQEGTQENLQQIFVFIHPSVLLNSTRNQFLNN